MLGDHRFSLGVLLLLPGLLDVLPFVGNLDRQRRITEPKEKSLPHMGVSQTRGLNIDLKYRPK